MAILIGMLLTLCVISLMCPIIIPLILFVIITTRITLWLCPALCTHIEQQRALYNGIEDDYELPIYNGSDIPDVVLYHIVKEGTDYNIVE